MKVVDDPSIARGGCLLETAFGDVDATPGKPVRPDRLPGALPRWTPLLREWER